MVITQNDASGGPQTWFWMHFTWNFTPEKMAYLPGPVDPNKQIQKNKKSVKTNAPENWIPARPPARPLERRVRVAAAPRKIPCVLFK